jgi:hypothetical protein
MVPFQWHPYIVREYKNMLLHWNHIGEWYKACEWASLYMLVTEQHTLKNVNNCENTKITFYLETFGGQNSNLYLNVVHFQHQC